MSNFFAKYRKTIAAVLGACATWAVSTFPDDLDVQRFVGLAIALLTALGVYAVRNDPPTSDAAPAQYPPVGEAGHTEVDTILLVIAVVGILLLCFGVTLR